MKQSPVEWLAKEIKTFEKDYGAIIHHKGELKKLLNQAKQMEAEQRKELSNKEIKKQAIEYANKVYDKSDFKDEWIGVLNDFIEGAKWYREQLKQK